MYTSFHGGFYTIDLCSVDAMRIYGKLPMDVSHQDDATSQAEGKAKQVDECV
jgi:hypothetical protein